MVQIHKFFTKTNLSVKRMKFVCFCIPSSHLTECTLSVVTAALSSFIAYILVFKPEVVSLLERQNLMFISIEISHLYTLQLV